MTCNETSRPQHRRPPLRTVMLGCAAFVAMAGFAGSALADHHGDDHHWHGRPIYHHWHHRYYGGGYYPPPPVVYGRPYYEPPPVVYGPGFGINVHIP